MSEPYNYTDPDMCTLKVKSGSIGGNVIVETYDPSDEAEVVVLVHSNHLDGLVAAMYRAIGRDVIVLNRMRWFGTDRKSYTINGVRVERDAKRITLQGMTFDAETARGLARVLAEMAEDADKEPDPAELAALAEVLRDAAHKDVQAADGEGRDLARLILAAGYRKAAIR